MNDRARTNAIRDLNDKFRKTLNGGTVALTAGIVALRAEAQARILAAVQAFDAFDEDNDPWGEHDFGMLMVPVQAPGSAQTIERIYFKLDYYDPTKTVHSVDPADPTRTERVMTIMLASEY